MLHCYYEINSILEMSPKQDILNGHHYSEWTLDTHIFTIYYVIGLEISSIKFSFLWHESISSGRKISSITQNPCFHRSVSWSSKLTTLWVVLQRGHKNIQCSTLPTTRTNLNNFVGTLNVSNSGCWTENWQTIILQTRWLNNNSTQKEM